MAKLLRGIILVGALVCAAVVSGCGSSQPAKTQEPAKIKVGVTAGPHAQIMEQVQKQAAADGLTVEIVEFSDFIQPNVALANGELALNSFQHQPFLDAQIKDRGYKFSVIGKTIILPMAIFSQKITDLAQIADGAVVAIPNDPTNGGRALLLMASAGLITLQDGAGLTSTAADIKDNPKNLQVKELEAAQVALSLPDVDFAVINANYAINAGLDPQRQALFVENGDSPYACIIVARDEDKDNPLYGKLVKAYHTDAVKQFIDNEFKGSCLAAW